MVASALLVLLIAVIAAGQAQQPDQSGYTISVVGQVNIVGTFRVRSDRTVTLLQAIALAHGFATRADKKNIEITRVGAPEQITIDAEKVLSGRAVDVPIKAGDVIRVPESRILQIAGHAWENHSSSGVHTSNCQFGCVRFHTSLSAQIWRAH